MEASNKNPEFGELVAALQKNPSLLAELLGAMPPFEHHCQPAESLLMWQNRRAEQRANSAERHLETLIASVRRHEAWSSHLHRLATELVRVEDRSDRVAVLTRVLREEFGADYVGLRIYAPTRGGGANQPSTVDDPSTSERELAAEIFRDRRPVAMPLPADFTSQMFLTTVGHIQDWWLVPLGEVEGKGLLVLGFTPGLIEGGPATSQFLDRLARLATAALWPDAGLDGA